jgi:hypothetical protein
MKELAITNFVGGINDVIEPHLIPLEMSTDLLNADVSNGAVISLKGLVQADIDATSELVYQNGDRQIVEWGNRFYWSDNETSELNSSLGYYGVPAPETAPNISDGVAGGRFVTNSTYTYAYAYATPDGFEGSLNPTLTNAYTPTTNLGSLIITNFGAPPEYVTKVVVYRTVANGAIFYRVGSKSLYDQELDGTFIFEDEVSDTQLLLRPQVDLTNLTDAITEGKYLVEKDSVFYVAVGPYVRFSNVNDPMAYPAVNSVTFDTDITGMLAFDEYVFVATRNQVYILLGSSFEDIVKQELPEAQGVKNWRTIQRVRNAPVWVSNDGVCSYQQFDNRSGRRVRVISEDLKTIPDGSVSATVANDVYYLFYDTYSICLDFNRGLKVYRVEWVADWGWYDKDNDKLIIKVGEAYFEAGTGKDLEFLYQSPELTFGDMQNLKQIGRVHVDANCDLAFEYIADGQLKSTYVSKRTDFDQRRFYVPPEWTGRRLQMRVKGIGEMRGIKLEYKFRRT